MLKTNSYLVYYNSPTKVHEGRNKGGESKFLLRMTNFKKLDHAEK